MENIKYQTEDGFIFTMQDDGSLTDGDMTFDSLDELKKHVDVEPLNNQTEKLDSLKAWQDGTLINDNAINKLSLKELNKINDMLTKAGY